MRLLLSLIISISSIIVISQDTGLSLANNLIHSEVLFGSDMNDEVSCYRIPAIVTAPNGDLIVAIDERVPSCGDLKWSDDINIVIRRSSDNGQNWSDIERIVDYPMGKSASDPSMIVDQTTAEIFLFYNFMDLVNEKDVYYLHVIKSADNGKTWSEASDITSQISKTEWHNDFKFITSGRGIQTSTGKLLHCLVNLEHGMHLFGSDDHGRSWYLFDTAVKPGNESKVVELSDGSWMINSRLNAPGYRQVHISADEGESWISKEEHVLLDPGCNASIIRYLSTEKGISCLIFANASHPNRRENMTVRLSYDDGQTWSKGICIYEGPSAYSSLTVLQNGHIGLFFEKEEYREMVFVSFSFEQLNDR